MYKRFAGQVALITGSTRGLGKAAALALAVEGATVVVNSRKEPDCSAVVGEIEAAGGRAVGMAADVSDLGQVRDLVETTIARFGCLDILVNNAGFFSDPDVFWNQSEANLLYTVNLNLKALHGFEG